MTTTMTSREFNQNTSGAKQAANAGPVIITDRGKPAYVLLKAEDYERLKGLNFSLLDALEQQGGPEYDFDIELPERRIDALRDPFEQ